MKTKKKIKELEERINKLEKLVFNGKNLVKTVMFTY